MNSVESKAQDGILMNLLEAHIRDTMANEEGTAVTVMREHERKMLIVFPDGRTVTLVLYGPRGK